MEEKIRALCQSVYAEAERETETFVKATHDGENKEKLHLGGSYWQRASFDAVIVLLSLFGVIAFAPTMARMRTHHRATAVVTIVAVAFFYLVLFKSIKYVGKRVGPRLIDIEEAGPKVLIPGVPNLGNI